MVTGGQDSLVCEWDLNEMMCSGSVSFDEFQIKKLAYNSNGEYLAQVVYDEMSYTNLEHNNTSMIKKWRLQVSCVGQGS